MLQIFLFIEKQNPAIHPAEMMKSRQPWSTSSMSKVQPLTIDKQFLRMGNLRV